MARILIVEDELALRSVITLNLVRRGYTVAEADSVTSANEACAASSEPFDLILLDIYLPDQTGWDVLRNLEECGPPKPVGSVPAESGPSRPQIIVMTAVRPQHSPLSRYCARLSLSIPLPARSWG